MCVAGTTLVKCSVQILLCLLQKNQSDFRLNRGGQLGPLICHSHLRVCGKSNTRSHCAYQNEAKDSKPGFFLFCIFLLSR